MQELYFIQLKTAKCICLMWRSAKAFVHWTDLEPHSHSYTDWTAQRFLNASALCLVTGGLCKSSLCRACSLYSMLPFHTPLFCQTQKDLATTFRLLPSILSPSSDTSNYLMNLGVMILIWATMINLFLPHPPNHPSANLTLLPQLTPLQCLPTDWFLTKACESPACPHLLSSNPLYKF